jgi:hypothetical protein
VKRRDWDPIIARAAKIVSSYDTEVTLRQLFYRLVAAEVLRNVPGDYHALSGRTAKLRRVGEFPQLVDPTRSLGRMQSWESMSEAVRDRIAEFRLDHALGQERDIHIIVEKAALERQLWDWFGDLGIAVTALRGHHSVGLERQIMRDLHARRNGREEPIALYVGDFDPSGTDIERNFARHLGSYFAEVRRVALSWEQVEEHDLPPQLGKANDPRAKAFAAEHGRLVQVEADALPPDVLRDLLTEAVDEFYDHDIYESVVEREQEIIDIAEGLVENLGNDDEEAD